MVHPRASRGSRFLLNNHYVAPDVAPALEHRLDTLGAPEHFLPPRDAQVLIERLILVAIALGVLIAPEGFLFVHDPEARETVYQVDILGSM